MDQVDTLHGHRCAMGTTELRVYVSQKSTVYSVMEEDLFGGKGVGGDKTKPEVSTDLLMSYSRLLKCPMLHYATIGGGCD